MKFSDYQRLGKISIKTRIKSTKNSTRGISFGLILLIPILFFVFSFYISLNKSIKQTPTIASFIVETKHYTDSTPTTYYVNDVENKRFVNGGLSYDFLDKFTSIKGVKDYIVSEYFNINFIHSKIALDDEIYDFERKDYLSDEIALNSLFKIFHPDLSTGLFSKAEEFDMLQMSHDNIFISGSGFIGDGKGQVIISETLVNHYQLNMDDIIGKRFTFNMYSEKTEYIDNNTNPYDQFLPKDSLQLHGRHYEIIKDFIVVGVIKEDLYRLPSRTNEAHIWLSKSSLYDNHGNHFLPTISFKEVTVRDAKFEIPVHTYSSTNVISLVKQANAHHMVFIPLGFGATIVSYNKIAIDLTKPRLITLIQFDNIKSAIAMENKVIDLYSNAYPTSAINYKNSLYQIYQVVNEVGIYISITVLTFGGIIFLATLLNLYNTVAYSVKTRTNYIGVMRAIGAKQKIIPKMYFYEIMLIFFQAFIYIIILSGIFSLAIKYKVEDIFSKNAGIIPFTIKLNFWFFPLTLIVIVIFQYLIGIIFSAIACKKVSQKPILEILKDER